MNPFFYDLPQIITFYEELINSARNEKRYAQAAYLETELQELLSKVHDDNLSSN